ncbi:porin [Odoribacter laneus]|jgi:hypothetical protein|uniref:porin n=1 Tax=Odoribacter laneus TaxID=626933 RepID=UPI001898AB24|nr:porin [Odoribacter laneus]
METDRMKNGVGRRTLILFLGLFLLLFPLQIIAQAFVKSSTGDFEWKMTGRALFDGGIFFSDSSRLGNGMVISDVRLGTSVRFLKNWEGKIELGYRDSKVSLKDIYVAYRRGDHMLKVGHYFEHWGLDYRLGSLRFRLMTMSVTDAVFGDKRKVGFSYIYNSRAITTSAGFFSDGDTDNVKSLDEGYVIAAQFIGRPLYDEEKLVHLGIGVRYSEHDKAEREEISFKGGAPTEVLSKNENVFVRTRITNMINQWRFGADVILFYRGTYLQSECLAAHVNRAGGENYTGKGVYVQMGYLVWGNKQYKYDRSQGGVSNPDPKNLELLFRYNVTDLNDRQADIWGGKEQDITLGINYFINKYIGVKLNYTHMWTDSHAVGGKEKFDFIQGRFQFSF